MCPSPRDPYKKRLVYVLLGIFYAITYREAYIFYINGIIYAAHVVEISLLHVSASPSSRLFPVLQGPAHSLRKP